MKHVPYVNAGEHLRFVERACVLVGTEPRPDYVTRADFVMPWWTDEDFGRERQCQWFSVYLLDIEVARIMLEPRERFSHWFPTLPPEEGFTEVVFLEVAYALRGHEIGHHVVRRLGELSQGRLLAAISQDEKSDRFWLSVGWTLHHHSVIHNMRRIFTDSLSPAQSSPSS